MNTTSAHATPEFPVELLDSFNRAAKARLIETEREKAGLTTKPILRRNETGNPLSLPRGCSLRSDLLVRDLRCDGSDAACRLVGQKPVVAPGEPFWTPEGHYYKPSPDLPEVDPASVADEPTLQDRLLLGELRAFEQRAEGPATLAARTLADLSAQKRILEDRILQQQEEVDRRQAHVEAAKAKTEEFLGSRSEAWRETLLGGGPGAALAAAKRAADEAERRRPEIHTVGDLRRAQTEDVKPTAFAMGAGGPVSLKVTGAEGS